MKNRQFIIFVSAFTFIFVCLNYIFLALVASYVDIAQNILFVFIVIFLGVSFTLANWAKSCAQNWLSDAFYLFAAVWLGVLQIGLGLVVLYEFLDIFITIDQVLVGKTIIFSTIILSIYACIAGNTVRVKKLQIKTKKSVSLRIVHLSDLHIGPIHKEKFLDRVVKKVIAQDPDVVVITGDLLDRPGVPSDSVLSSINDISVPVYVTLGNHDEYVGLQTAKRIFKNASVILLQNQVETRNGFAFIGVDDSKNKDQVRKQLKKLKVSKDTFNILLYHRPWGVEDASKNNIDLMLSGHTHVGQIISFTPFVRIAFKHLYGLHKIGTMWLHVTSGTGTWGPPMRLGSRNEITVIDISSN